MGNAAPTGMDRDAELRDRLATWQERYRVVWCTDAAVARAADIG